MEIPQRKQPLIETIEENELLENQSQLNKRIFQAHMQGIDQDLQDA